MKLLSSSVFLGSSIYARRPVVRLAVDPEGVAPMAGDAFLARAARRLPADGPWPQLRQALERLLDAEGTADWPRVLGGLAVLLQDDRFEAPLRHRSEPAPGAAASLILVETNEPPLGQEAALLAFRIVSHLFSPAPEPEKEAESSRLAETARRFLQSREQIRHDPNTRLIVESAIQRGVPLSMPTTALGAIFLGQGHRLIRMHQFFGDSTSLVALHIAHDKHLTARALAAVGIPVPEQRVARSREEVAAAVAEIGFPLVIKGRTGGQGKGVTTNITAMAAVEPAVQKALLEAEEVIVESHIQGEDFRLTVVDGRMVAAARRVPAQVVGDGGRTLRELVAVENARRRNSGRFAYWIVPLAIDEESQAMLADAGLTPDSVPPAGRPVRLRSAGNFSQGGLSEDVTELVHPEVVQAVERAARTVGLDMAGIDLLTTDITRPLQEAGGAINEVNGLPAARAHCITPTAARDVAGPVIDHLFPPPHRGRIPTVAITGRKNEATCHLAAAVLEAAGFVVGSATGSGLSIGRELVRNGNCADARGAQLILQDRQVQAGVFEISPRSLLRDGLRWDSCDVGVVATVAVPPGGGRTDEVIRAQRLPIEVARRAAILDADDPRCVEFAAHAAAPIWWVSRSSDKDDLAARLAGGANAVLLEEVDGVRTVVHRAEDTATPVLALPADDAEGDERGERTVEATLFAAAIALALGQDGRHLRAALAQAAD